jgi:Ca-activated chloride channel homolog
LLTEAAEPTGGRMYQADDINELPDIGAKIGMELRSQYILGYCPTNGDRDGKYRRVDIRIIQPRGLPTLGAYWKMGYYAPVQ